MKKNEKGCQYYDRKKTKLSGQVPHSNFYYGIAGISSETILKL